MQPIFSTYDVGKLKKAKAYLLLAIRRCDIQNQEVADANIYSENQKAKKLHLVHLAFINSQLKNLGNDETN